MCSLIKTNDQKYISKCSIKYKVLYIIFFFYLLLQTIHTQTNIRCIHIINIFILYNIVIYAKLSFVCVCVYKGSLKCHVDPIYECLNSIIFPTQYHKTHRHRRCLHGAFKVNRMILFLWKGIVGFIFS